MNLLYCYLETVYSSKIYKVERMVWWLLLNRNACLTGATEHHSQKKKEVLKKSIWTSALEDILIWKSLDPFFEIKMVSLEACFMIKLIAVPHFH